MSRLLRRKKVDNTIEKNIITNLIMSDKFCNEISKIFDANFFKLEYGKKISTWCVDYYEKYLEAPKLNIRDIYELKKVDLDESESELIFEFLTNLSDDYEIVDNINIEYVTDNAKKYFKKRSLEILSENISTAINAGEVDEAEKFLLKHHKVDMDLSEWFDPFEKSEIDDTFKNTDADKLFKFPGVLGDVFGYFERGWLIGVIAPMKRGKTHILQEIAVEGLYNKFKVVWISLEMSKTKTKSRLYKRITGLLEGEKQELIYPVFDCKKNQDGRCRLPHRKNKIKIADKEGNIPDFKPGMQYKICDYCKENNKRMFEPTVWYEIISRDKMTKSRTKKATDKFKNAFGSNLRIKIYPTFSAKLSDIIRDINLLEVEENFVPDVIIVDYFGITKPEDNRLSERGIVDNAWKIGKSLAAEKRALVVSAHQGTRASIDRKSMKQSDTSEDIRVLAHVDLLFALNQTPFEKRKKIMRISPLVCRHGDIDQLTEVTVLQNLSVGQAILDSEIIYNEKEDDGKKKG